MKSVFQKVILSMLTLCVIALTATIFTQKVSAEESTGNSVYVKANNGMHILVNNDNGDYTNYFDFTEIETGYYFITTGGNSASDYSCFMYNFETGKISELKQVKWRLVHPNGYDQGWTTLYFWRPGSDFEKQLVSSTLPIFKTSTGALNYIQTGDETGAFYLPTIPYDPLTETHDFSKDVYDPSIEMPKLSAISYTGFTIDNPDNKQWELVIEGKVFGLKFNPKYTDPLILTNYNYIVNRNKWNFADSPQILTADGYFSIYDNLKYSTYNWFYENVKQYKETVKPIEYPNYSLLKLAYKIGWDTFLDFVKDMGSEDEANQVTGSGHRFEQYLYNTRMCQITYYVRFVENDAEGNKHYSQWMTYTLKPSQEVFVEGEMLSKGNIEVGTVTNTNTITGSPIVADKEYYRYNPETGEYEYYDPKTYNLQNVDWTLSLDNLQSITSVFGQFPIFVANIFSAFPSWMVQLLGATITLLCALAIYHGIRG